MIEQMNGYTRMSDSMKDLELVRVWFKDTEWTIEELLWKIDVLEEESDMYKQEADNLYEYLNVEVGISHEELMKISSGNFKRRVH